MSMDEFTEVTEQGWLSRLGGAVKGVVAGVVIILAAIVVLWWNEGRAVNTAKKINFAKDKIVGVAADTLNDANNGKLIHLSGKADTEDILKDDAFNISVNAIKLIRNVEMYQWIEDKDSRSEKQLGGKKKTVTTYKYSQKWSSDLVDSNSFKQKTYTDESGATLSRKNPAVMPYSKMEKTAENVSVGKYKLGSGLVEQISKESPLALQEFKIKLDKPFSVTGDTVFVGKDSSRPAIGDMKISFEIVKPQEVSILAGQNAGGKLGPYTTPYGSYEQLVSGTVDAQGMIASAKASNNFFTWLLRFIGFIAVFIGFNLIFKPLSVIADIVPFIGDLVGMGTALIAFLLTLPLVTVVIGVAWIFYRPLIGIPLVLIAVGSIVAVFVMKKKRG